MALGHRRELGKFLMQVRAINLAGGDKKDVQPAMRKVMEESQ